MLVALAMFGVVLGHNVNQRLDATLYPAADGLARESSFRQKMDRLKRFVEDDGVKAARAREGWHQPEYSDVAPSPFVLPGENAHASPSSDPFALKYGPGAQQQPPLPMAQFEKSSQAHHITPTTVTKGTPIPQGFHRPNIMPSHTVFAETNSRVRSRRGEAGLESQDQAINLGGIVSSVVSAVAGAVSSSSNTGAKPEDIEDCVGCRYIWLQVEMDVGNSQIESNIYDSFKAHARDAQLSRIFYPATQDMFDAVDDMIGDYMDGFTVNQMCENSRICR